MCESQSVSTEHLETAPFDSKAFANEMVTSSHFEVAAQHPLAPFKEHTFHELYRDIALVKKWATRKDGEGFSLEGGEMGKKRER